MGYSSPVQSRIIADLKLSTADTMGLSDILYLTGWVAIAFSMDAGSLDVGRLSVGCAMGLTVYVVPVYIAEITPRNLRGGSVLLHKCVRCCCLSLLHKICCDYDVHSSSWEDVKQAPLLKCNGGHLVFWVVEVLVQAVFWGSAGSFCVAVVFSFFLIMQCCVLL
ncbi:sugar transporter ERD6-like 2 isoform X1 [Chenopodium quinoa]|uniref:sugar transporter ERD6-like 2 isoform X1 n=2 Tax=Chenopodium quinoa TaxID=63459 RepID=UPI000B7879C3|nr:sugar transporter ERD6-like 2 isoform X1 [Chenopodium quinoa]XP_021750747.1 sugar transporter ERD6-like 2 isoform X1 [Chenopodium quinoa]